MFKKLVKSRNVETFQYRDVFTFQIYRNTIKKCAPEQVLHVRRYVHDNGFPITLMCIPVYVHVANIQHY